MSAVIEAPSPYAERVPRCGRCGRLHRADLPCWRGHYRDRLVARVLRERGRTCWLCGEDGARTADHRTPRSLGGGDEMSNLMPAHLGCNSRRGNTPEPGNVAALVVISGPPGAGKTTYANTHAVLGDVVIDLDAITGALSAPDAGDPHAAPDHVRTIAQAARRAAITAAYRCPAGHTVWLIHTAPKPDAIAEYAVHGARFVTVDPGEAVTLAQGIAAGRPADHLDVARRYYRKGAPVSDSPAIAGASEAPPVPDGASSRWRDTPRPTTPPPTR